ncbi:hypothetical protein Fmac_006877 [Flemingia macrophylla]|uniref:Uncharacterized protein n=1 Tax=Flemingia macrophylla TaxID=520843 RepID=A0ABD1NBU0_9FABA
MEQETRIGELERIKGMEDKVKGIKACIFFSVGVRRVKECCCLTGSQQKE